MLKNTYFAIIKQMTKQLRIIDHPERARVMNTKRLITAPIYYDAG